ncbi:MAG: enoyl-CoA hydratase/isomerase family protein [Qipengyuania pacifica]
MGENVVSFDRREATGILMIDREEQRNALSNEVIDALRDGVARAKADPKVRVLVLRGAGDRAFCAGGDLAEMNEKEGNQYEAHLGRSQLALLFRDMWELGKPTIARVPGYALAGGFGLAAACDFIVASDQAVFGVPEVAVGLWPYMITLPLLHWLPPKQVLDLMLTARRVKADEAKSMGFVSRLVPPEELDTAIEELAEQLNATAPQSVALGRTAFYAAVNYDLDSRVRMLQAHLSVALTMPDAHEGLAAFAEKRKPNWKS